MLGRDTCGWNQSIASCFEDQVLAHGQRLAIRTDSAELTYAELNQLANHQARALRTLNVAPQEPVALLLEQGPAFIAGMLGVLKAGGCFVPLDPANPAGRNLQMLQDSGARVLLTSTECRSLAESVSGGCCEILEVVPAGGEGADGNPAITVDPDSLACLLFTSGSTGKPKGVMHDHRTLVHNAYRHREAFSITPEDRQTLLYTCSVYGGIRDILNALLCGASLHTFPVRKRGVDGLAEWLCQSRITIYCSVATVFRQLTATLTSRETFPDLRLMKLGGEASHRSDIELFRSHFPATCRLHCGFGSTETGVARHFFIDRDTPIEGEAIPLGYPVEDMEVSLLDEQDRPVAPGEVGEMVIRSRYISRGYWNRPDLNERLFGCDPQNPQIRIYRTGDLGVLRADGCLEHRGRKDGQVKIRGNRVETAEVETALRGLPGVAHGVVAVRRDQRNDNYLVGYVVSRGERLSIRELRRALAERLPDHMIPSTLVQIDALPQTPNGKVDRQNLPPPEACRPEFEQHYVAPQNALQEHLAALWSRLLGIERVGIQDDFFELGGSSLVAVRMMAQIRAEHGRILPLSLLFEARTVAALADVIARGHQSSTWSHVVPIHPQGRRTPLFCIHPGGGNVLGYQEFIAHLHPDQPVYGVQAHGVVEGQAPETSIHQMAVRYIQAIREIQPSGPYYLGGESFGGLVAYEMACQLIQGGERVAFLFIGDAWTQTRRHGRYLLASLTFPLTLKLSDWRKIWERKVLRRRKYRAAVKRYLYADDLHRSNSLAHREAARNFAPRRYPGVLTLFRAEDRDYSARRMQHYFGGPDMGWAATASTVEVHWMPDIHREMMHGPNARGFAQKLQECIDRARALEASRNGSATDGSAQSALDGVAADQTAASRIALEA